MRKIRKVEPLLQAIPARKRVAAYARVSSSKEAMLNSLSAQISRYSGYIQKQRGWEYAGVYADEALTGTKDERSEFQRLMDDCRAGKIDMILTKSISRFARNTVTTLEATRELKALNVDVYFERENIHSMSGSGEFMLTILASFAQEESRSVSENVLWGVRKRMEDGKFTLPYKRFLGYEKGPDGLPQIIEAEAKIIRLIYAMFLQGKSVSSIARYLTGEGVPTPAKKEKWSVSTIFSILQNEKYKGEAMLQKEFTVDFLTKRKKKNEGEVPQYYVENSHPAIVPPETFDLAREELQKRRGAGQSQSGLSPFSSRIICGECGNFYGSKVWHSTSRYRRVIWRCNYKYKGGGKCKTPHLYEASVQKAFVEAFNKLFGDKARLVEDYAEIIRVLADTSALEKEAKKHQNECNAITELIRECVEENAQVAMNQSEYNARRNELIKRHNAAKSQFEEVLAKKQERGVKRENLSRFMAELEHRDGVLEAFDEQLWYEVVETATVYSESDIAVTFRDSTVIQVEILEK